MANELSLHRDALNVALGLGVGPSPDLLVVGNAVLAQQSGAPLF